MLINILSKKEVYIKQKTKSGDYTEKKFISLIIIMDLLIFMLLVAVIWGKSDTFAKKSEKWYNISPKKKNYYLINNNKK